MDVDEDCRFGKVYLGSHEDLVRYSFLVQKSLTPLDLSTLEFSCRSPTTFTEEGFQKLNAVKERRVLFKYNLDVSHGLEKALKENDPSLKFGITNKFDPSLKFGITNKFNTSVYRGVKLFPENYYYHCVFPDIMEAIENSRNKTVALKKFLPLMKMMQVSSNGLTDNQHSSFACIFQEECADSELVVEFVKVIGKEHFFRWLLRNFGKMEHMEYFLHHLQKMNIEIQFEGNRCPVSRSLFMGKFRRAIALIRYGKFMQPLNNKDVKHYVELFSIFNYTANVINWIKYTKRYYREPDNLSHVKKLLFLLLVSVLEQNMKYDMYSEIFNKDRESSDLGFKALRLMWRSLPEPYLTLSEVRSLWRPGNDLDEPTADEVYTMYKTEIIDAEYQVVDGEGPRSLKHLTRCEIRRRLAIICALPDGIQHLGLPHQLREFLSMEC